MTRGSRNKLGQIAQMKETHERKSELWQDFSDHPEAAREKIDLATLERSPPRDHTSFTQLRPLANTLRRSDNESYRT